jgi:hypothetical protein
LKCFAHELSRLLPDVFRDQLNSTAGDSPEERKATAEQMDKFVDAHWQRMTTWRYRNGHVEPLRRGSLPWMSKDLSIPVASAKDGKVDFIVEARFDGRPRSIGTEITGIRRGEAGDGGGFTEEGDFRSTK